MFICMQKKSILCLTFLRYCKLAILGTLGIGASRIRNLGTCIFVHIITYLCTRSCTSYFVHFKQSFLYVCTLTCTLLCTYYRDKNILEQKVNLRSIPLTINPEPSLGNQTVFYRERNNRFTLGHVIKQYFLLGLRGKERIMSLSNLQNICLSICKNNYTHKVLFFH